MSVKRRRDGGKGTPRRQKEKMEQIYTIPVNEAFDDSRDHPECGCPLCTLYRKLEEDELSLILGASMMEPDIRIRTNREGFCPKHFTAMLTRKNRLGMALMLESHLNELSPELFPHGLAALTGKGSGAIPRLSELEGSCYVCSRIEFNLSRMAETVVLLWSQDGLFREKFKQQPHFCLPHYRRLLTVGRDRLGRREKGEFFREIGEIEERWFASLSSDVSAFCRSFDYRAEEPLTDEQKTAVERAVKGLSGLEGREIKPC